MQHVTHSMEAQFCFPGIPNYIGTCLPACLLANFVYMIIDSSMHDTESYSTIFFSVHAAIYFNCMIAFPCRESKVEVVKVVATVAVVCMFDDYR